MEFLTVEEICDINHDLIAQTSGWFVPPTNLRYRDALEYATQAIRGDIFGVNLYPTLLDKAAALMILVIHDHPFNDTNKRTGVECALALLELNGMSIEATEDDIFELAMSVQADTTDHVGVVGWLADRATSPEL